MTGFFDPTVNMDDPFHNTPPPIPGGDEHLRTIRHLGTLLRDELAADDMYRMAIHKIAESPKALNIDVGLLRDVQQEHHHAAAAIRDRIVELGGEPAKSSGARGVWARLSMETARLFGDKSALVGLKEGEQHELKDFRKGVHEIDARSSDLFQKELIPAQERHIDLLNLLIDTIQ